MKKYKKVIAAGALAIGMGAGAIIFSPAGMHASSNVILASVDWVNSQLSPINSKVSSLESQLNSQQTTITKLQQTINSQQQQINKLIGSNGTNATPSNTGIPSVVYVSKSTATVHSGASRKYKIVATKSKGTSIKVIDSFKTSTGLWYRVSLSTTLKGWIYSGDISITKVAVSSPSKVITTGQVYLRKGAYTGYPSIQLLSKGTTLKYIQSFMNSRGETWYNVETSTGKRGWIISTLGEVK